MSSVAGYIGQGIPAAAALSLTVGTADASYPLAALTDGYGTIAFKTTGTSARIRIYNSAASWSCSGVALIGHNFTEAAQTITLKYRNDTTNDYSTATALSTITTQSNMDLNQTLFATFGSVSLKSLYIDLPTGLIASGVLRLSEIIAGAFVNLTKGPDASPYNPQIIGSRHTNKDGSSQFIEFGRANGLRLDFAALSVAELTELKRLWKDFGREKIAWIANKDDPTLLPCYYGSMETFEIRPLGNSYHNASMDFVGEGECGV